MEYCKIKALNPMRRVLYKIISNKTYFVGMFNKSLQLFQRYARLIKRTNIQRKHSHVTFIRKLIGLHSI